MPDETLGENCKNTKEETIGQEQFWVKGSKKSEWTMTWTWAGTLCNSTETVGNTKQKDMYQNLTVSSSGWFNCGLFSTFVFDTKFSPMNIFLLCNQKKN